MTPRRRILPVFVPNLGCPHRCVFCDQRRITGAAKPAGAEDVYRIAAGAGEQGDYELAFYGGSFTAIPTALQDELLQAARRCMADGRIRSVRLSTRPDCMDLPTALRLAGQGVETVELGAQSMCDDVLAASGRGHTAADTVRAARAVKEAGLRLVLQMMTGLPGDTPEKSRSTARALAALEPDGVRIYPTVILRGTELWEMWRAGAYREHTVEDAVELCADLTEIFAAAGIPVIRLGLNPTEDLSGGEAAGGAYHPALGELVYSRVYLRRARALLAGTGPGADAVLHVGRGRTSVMTGQRRCNAEALIAEFGLRSLKIREDETLGDGLYLTFPGGSDI